MYYTTVRLFFKSVYILVFSKHEFLYSLNMQLKEEITFYQVT